MPIPPTKLLKKMPMMHANLSHISNLHPLPSFKHGFPRGLNNNRKCKRCGTIRAAGNDYYKTLKVGRNATFQDIKASYKKLARQYHPDMNKSPGAEENFKEISSAYEVLSDDEKRSLYDRFGEAGLRGEYDGSDSGTQGVDPFEIYNTFFGGSDGLFGGMGEPGGANYNLRSKGNWGLNIWFDLHLSFEESIFGGQREIEVSCFESCDDCGGTGAKSSSCIQSCIACGGRGGVMKTQRTPFGMMSQVTTCSNCGGDGKIISDYCRRCSGSGKVQSKRNLTVVIPPGVNNGATMQLQGEGDFDKKRSLSGDLFIVLHVDEKQGIQRDGLNLYSKINVDYTEAILGTRMKVETVEGMKDLQIPSGIQPGDTIKLQQMGVPDLNKPSVRGDHLFIVNVLIPKDISETERKLVKELACLKSSSGSRSVSSNTENGQYNSNQDTVGDHKKHESSKGIKRAGDLWNSIKSFLGQRQSQERFASIVVDSMTPLSSSKPDSLLMVSVFAAFTVACIFNLIGKRDRCLSLQQRNHRRL